MEQNYIQDLFTRCGVNVNQVIKRTVNLPPQEESTPIHEKIEICLKLLEDQQKSEFWPSGISTFTINSYPLSKLARHFQLLENSPHRILLKKTSHTCSVCLEHTHPGETIRTLRCEHIFHKKCIDDWLKLKGRCPLDRLSML